MSFFSVNSKRVAVQPLTNATVLSLRTRSAGNAVDIMIFPELPAATHVCPEFIKKKRKPVWPAL
jgi:hypothetical protein